LPSQQNPKDKSPTNLVTRQTPTTKIQRHRCRSRFVDVLAEVKWRSEEATLKFAKSINEIRDMLALTARC